ncbi:hypothetical protein E2K93_07085 [Thalassotalea sp. HSM 43]|uniref:RDD family protein n=1 Tax=Thalassotalea sp. HSM 43 TaxID=2552945 RepID=UPI001080A348|nr:RDD family protein [Thalassotalea sp. HSM 43]QBY04164.1 hypothetical protein E2K93_07085 [Thalassotalea sp. HSM 43]
MSYQYASAWQRLMANAIDGLILLLPMLLLSSLAFIDISVAVLATVIGYGLFWYYSYYFHGKYGATFGKHFMGIIVLDRQGNRFTYRTAFVRGLIDMLFAIVIGAVALQALFAMDFSHFQSLGFFAREAYHESFKPDYMNLIINLYGYWLLSEFLLMHSNKNRQAIADMMADTIVVVKQKSKVSAVA